MLFSPVFDQIYGKLKQYELTRIKIPVPSIPLQNKIATHIQAIRQQARQLETEAAAILATAKAQVERMILGEE